MSRNSGAAVLLPVEDAFLKVSTMVTCSEPTSNLEVAVQVPSTHCITGGTAGLGVGKSARCVEASKPPPLMRAGSTGNLKSLTFMPSLSAWPERSCSFTFLRVHDRFQEPIFEEILKKNAKAINLLRGKADDIFMMGKKRQEQAADVETLRALIEEGLNKRSLLSEMELSTEEEKQQLGQRRMDEKLASLPPELGAPTKCSRCGGTCKVRAKNVPRTFTGLSGTHTFTRNYYYCSTCKFGFCPRDEELGLSPDSEVSDELAKRLADFALNETFDMCEQRWPVHYPSISASANLFRQVAKRLGQRLEAADALALENAVKPPTAVPPEVLYVENDGSMVSMQRGDWREVKSAVIFSSDKHVKSTEERRGSVSDARYVSVLGGQDEFKKALQPSLQVANVLKVATVIWLADGAKGNWTLAFRLCPKAIQILDWYHAMENAANAAKTLMGEGDACVELFCSRIAQLLRAGQVKQCINELLLCIEETSTAEQLKAINTLVGYYRANQKRMRYDDYIANGWLIGSGAIEATHRHVIHARMKKAGQHWSERGGRRMARMRAAYRTAGADRFFKAISWAHRASLSNKTLAKPKKRRASNR